MTTLTTTRYTQVAPPIEWTDREISNLCFNLVKEAVRDLHDHRKTKQRKQESREWLFSNDTVHPFSAVNCCDRANLDIHSLRANVIRLLRGDIRHAI